MTTYTKIQNVKEFLERKGIKRVRDHSFKSQILSWPFCSQCGLVLLKNETSRKCAQQKCVVWED